jgi:hypothetical protein
MSYFSVLCKVALFFKDERHLGKLKLYLIFTNLGIMLDVYEPKFNSPNIFILMTSQ